MLSSFVHSFHLLNNTYKDNNTVVIPATQYSFSSHDVLDLFVLLYLLSACIIGLVRSFKERN